MRFSKLPIAAAILVAMTMSHAQAQYVGGGTPDLFNGAAGSNGPTSYEGQRSNAGNYGTDDQAPEAGQAPPPAPPAKAKRKVKTRRKPHGTHSTKPVQPTEAAPQ